ncbi:unnamed protein product [Boreogadus saida]
MQAVHAERAGGEGDRPVETVWMFCRPPGPPQWTPTGILPPECPQASTPLHCIMGIKPDFKHGVWLLRGDSSMELVLQGQQQYITDKEA